MVEVEDPYPVLPVMTWLEGDEVVPAVWSCAVEREGAHLKCKDEAQVGPKLEGACMCSV